MFANFESIKKNFRLKPKAYTITNWMFKLHYRITTLILFVACILVTSRQYIGDHISCINDSGVPTNVTNTFCFFTSTFTVISQYDDDMVASGNLAHPGVGPYGMNSTEPIKHHAYYQWVPFVLFGQAIMFYMVYKFWKHYEGGRMRNLISGLQFAGFSYLEKELKIGDKKIPTKIQKEEYKSAIRRLFIERICINRSWALWMIVFEIINVLHLIFQIYITNVFLNGEFLTLGTDVMSEGLDELVTKLDEVFPKVTKCTFYKYGPSGSIQLHDAMCVMALNIINEKIYIFLWFWFLFLFIVSCIAVIWRLITIILHARSMQFNNLVFSLSYPGHLDRWKLLTVTSHLNFSDWLFFRYLSKNLDPVIFKDILTDLAEDLDRIEKDQEEPLLDLFSDNFSTIEKCEKYE